MSATTRPCIPLPSPRQGGAVLIIMLVALVLLASAILLDRLNAAATPTPFGDRESTETLARAKEALIAWAAAHPDTPGLLPFPDRSDDPTPDYNGQADCVAAASIGPGSLLGRFPIQGEQAGICSATIGMSVTVDDSGGERLFYAVSRNLVRGGGGGPVNPDIGELAAQPWITVRDQTGTVISNRVAAVLIAPGPALSSQDRSAIDSNPAVEYPKYLESVTIGANTFDNADADGCLDDDPGCTVPGEDFIIYPKTTDAFNDRLVFITIDELMAAVEDRVLGEAATALNSYRASFTENLYPWVSPFTNPRSPQGAATGGGATALVDAGTDFVAAGVSAGDLVRNLTDGSIGPVAVGGVTANTLTLEGLIGGGANTFAAGDRYIVHPSAKFQGNAGTLEGMLPLHLPNEVFRTGFTINWNFAGEKNDDVGGDPSLQPTVAAIDHFDGNDLIIDLTQAGHDGWCKWTQSDRVDCRGQAYLPGQGTGGSDRTVEVWFNFDATTTTVVAPTGTDVRRRNHTYNGNYDGPVTPVAAPDMPQQTWSVRITDDDGILAPGWRLGVRDASTDLVINKFDGIRYEIGVGVGGELPAWFVENNWHHFIYTALSSDVVFGGNADLDDDCSTPVNTCLEIQYNTAAVPVTVRGNVKALVVAPGPVLANQDRTIGDCDGDALFDDFLCAYFELPNTDLDPIFGRAPANTFEVNATFNDHLRPVP